MAKKIPQDVAFKLAQKAKEAEKKAKEAEKKAKDAEKKIKEAEKNNIPMAFTRSRHFKH